MSEFDAAVLKGQVKRFYQVIWDQQDHDAVPSVLSSGCRFRGSLGEQKTGHQGFIEYLDSVHRALGDYRCHIETLVCEGHQVFARMTFAGVHRDTFMGYPPYSPAGQLERCRSFHFCRRQGGGAVGLG